MDPQPRWALPVGVAVVILVVVANGLSAVGLGTSGDALIVTLGVAVYAAAALLFLLWDDAPLAMTIALLLIMAGAATATHSGDPTGTGGIGLYLGVAYAPLRLPRRAAVAVAAFSVAVFDVHLAIEAANRAVFIVVVTGGAALFFLFGLLLHSEQTQRRRAGRLLAELAASREAEKASAALAERARLARELHDILAHTLSALVLQLEALSVRAQRGDDAKLADSLDRVHRLAKNGLGEARQAVRALRGDAPPGRAAIAELVEQHRAATGCPCELVEVGAPGELPAQSWVALHRTVQEALTNARKHAAGAPVTVLIRWHEAGATVEVVDRGGRGHDSLDRSGAGFGLVGLAERAALIGGRLEAGATEDGFRVTLEVPR
jgi:signal transduction histidine kinase